MYILGEIKGRQTEREERGYNLQYRCIYKNI